MGRAMTSAYRQGDLDTGHGFHETAQGVLLTVSESALREVLPRLLRLNHERWEEEQKAVEGVESQKPKVKGRKKSKSTDGQMGSL